MASGCSSCWARLPEQHATACTSSSCRRVACVPENHRPPWPMNQGLEPLGLLPSPTCSCSRGIADMSRVDCSPIRTPDSGHGGWMI